MNKKKRITLGTKKESQLLGVCAGLSNYFDIDVVWLRLSFLICFFLGFGVLPYLCCYIVFPHADESV